MPTRRGRGAHRYAAGSYSFGSDGRHRWQYATSTATGAKKRLDIRKRTLEDLDAAVDAYLAAERTIGHAPDGDTQGLVGYLNEWLSTVVSLRNSPSTVLKYRYDLQRLMPYLRQHTLRSLRTSHIQAALKAMRDTPYAPATTTSPARYYAASTIERALDVLKNALGDAVTQGRIPKNVALGVSGPAVEDFEPHALSLAEAKQLLAAAQTDRLQALYEVMLVYGLRRGEVLGLRWQDVDVDARTLRIAQQVIKLGNRTVIRPPKTKAAAAKLPLDQSLIPVLLAQRGRIAEVRDAAKRWTDHDLVFPSNVGTPMAPRNLIRSFKALLGRAKLPTTIRFHDLRHSVATFLAASGVHPSVAQQILRHADSRITLDVYTHVTLDQQRAAAEQLRRLITLPDSTEEVA